MNDKDKEERAIWVEFAKATIQSYEPPEELDKLDEVVDDMAGLAGMVADAVLEEYRDRFDGRAERSRPAGRGRGRKRDDEEPEK